MPRSDRICHVGTRDRPFYSFTYGRAYIYFLEAVVGALVGVAGFIAFLVASTVMGPLALVPVLPSALGASFVTGCVVAKASFFVHRRWMFAGGAACTLVAGATVTGLSLASGNAPWAGPVALLAGILLVCVVLVALVLLRRAHGKIGIFTDGIKIGAKHFLYEDIIAVAHGTGRDIQGKVPPQGKGKPLVVLTPIEYEYVEKDFGIFHVYLLFVTGDAVYVAQSITKQSNLAQDTRNAWSRRVLGHE